MVLNKKSLMTARKLVLVDSDRSQCQNNECDLLSQTICRFDLYSDRRHSSNTGKMAHQGNMYVQTVTCSSINLVCLFPRALPTKRFKLLGSTAGFQIKRLTQSVSFLSRALGAVGATFGRDNPNPNRNFWVIRAQSVGSTGVPDHRAHGLGSIF